MPVPTASKPDAARTPASIVLPPPRVPAWHAVTRGVALFFGLFLLLQVWAELRAESLWTDWWWIDLRPVSPFTARGLLALYGILLVIFALSGDEPKPLRFLCWACSIALFGFALWNTFRWYGDLTTGAIRSPVHVPCFLQTAAFLSVVMAGLARRPSDGERGGAFLIGLLTFDVCVVILPLVQILCAGSLDDRGKFDTMVVIVPENDTGDENALKVCVSILKASPRSPVCLIGSAERIAAWSDRLSAEMKADVNHLETIESTGDDRRAIRALAKRAVEAKWSSILAVGEAIGLPRWRIQIARIPLAVTQAPFTRRTPDEWGRILAELPLFWMSVLRPE